VAEGGGLLNRYRGLNLYRGFESPSLRHLIDFTMKNGARRITLDSPRAPLETQIATGTIAVLFSNEHLGHRSFDRFGGALVGIAEHVGVNG
jgi:hypothetical protein